MVSRGRVRGEGEEGLCWGAERICPLIGLHPSSGPDFDMPRKLPRVHPTFIPFFPVTITVPVLSLTTAMLASFPDSHPTPANVRPYSKRVFSQRPLCVCPYSPSHIVVVTSTATQQASPRLALKVAVFTVLPSSAARYCTVKCPIERHGMA
jgi:hypothetical protein